jgi:hypothetical protein
MALRYRSGRREASELIPSFAGMCDAIRPISKEKEMIFSFKLNPKGTDFQQKYGKRY